MGLELDTATDFLKRHLRRNSDFAAIKADYDALVSEMKKPAGEAGEKLLFCLNGQEMPILVTDLTAGYYSSRFISRYGCGEYCKQSKELMLYERQTEIIRQLEEPEQL